MRTYLYLFLVFSILLMSWELGREDTALAASSDKIPEESIRLRIIANSDSIEDQWLKQKIRDLITEEINLWVGSLDSIEEARQIIDNHIPDIERIVYEAMEQYGYSYSTEPKVELGIIEFPTKMYGETVYPAGEYEALRITLGDGQGENWWCVLFPPLCFVDMSTGNAVQTEEIITSNVTESSKKGANDIEIRFFLGDIFSKIAALIFG